MRAPIPVHGRLEQAAIRHYGWRKHDDQAAFQVRVQVMDQAADHVECAFLFRLMEQGRRQFQRNPRLVVDHELCPLVQRARTWRPLDIAGMIRRSTPKSWSWTQGNMRSGGFFYSFWNESYSHSYSGPLRRMGADVVIAVTRTLS